VHTKSRFSLNQGFAAGQNQSFKNKFDLTGNLIK